MTFKQLKSSIDLKIANDMYLTVLKEKWDKAIDDYYEKGREAAKEYYEQHKNKQ